MAFDACQYCQKASFDFGDGIGRSVPIDAPFYGAGEILNGTMGGSMVMSMAAYGTIHPNCRCDIDPVLDF